MRHQAFYYHHKLFGGTVGNPVARCYATPDEQPVCLMEPGNTEPTCLMRDAMCLETRCTSKGQVEAVFRFDDGATVVAVPCPQGECASRMYDRLHAEVAQFQTATHTHTRLAAMLQRRAVPGSHSAAVPALPSQAL